MRKEKESQKIRNEKDKMNIVVTGATGFLGKEIVGELLRSGHRVTVLTRDVTKAKARMDSRAEPVAWGEGTSESWKKSVSESDAVIHLAGESVAGERWTPEYKRKLRSSRVTPTRALVNAIAEGEHKPKVLISASAVGFYGDRKEELLTEKSAPGTDFLAEVCVEWEREISRVAEFGVREVRMRIGIVLGEEGALAQMLKPLPLPFNPYKLGLGGPMGSGRQWVPWIHVSDIVGLFLWALQMESVQGAVNAVSPNPVRNAEFARAIGKVYHRPAVIPVPAFALKAILGEFAESLLGGQRAVPAVAESLRYRFRYEELETALQSLLSEEREEED